MPPHRKEFVPTDYLLFLLTNFCQNVHRNLLLSAASGRQVSAVKVFSHALRYFKEQFIQEIQDQSSTGVVETDIRWVITVPAIWSPSAKQFVRLAAFEVCVYTNIATYSIV